MIPNLCDDGAAPGEKALFSALRKAPDDWVVLHSQAVAEHVRQVEGEADFVVIVPSAGVLVLEVKSHLTIDRLADGRWKLGRDAPTARGPFQQAAENMHSLRNYVEHKNVDLQSIPMISAVWFTHVRARTMLPTSPEWHDWQVLDSEDLHVDPVAAINRTLTSGAAHLDSKIRYFSYGGVGPSAEAADRIANVLRPRFELSTVAGDLRRNRETQLAGFLEEQCLALDAMAENRAVLFVGPAGSGKTLLAAEIARREASAGSTGHLLCFNRLLGRHLSDTLGGFRGLTVSTLHQAMLRLTNMQVPEQAGQDFWRRELPERAAEVLLDQQGPPCDFLVIDEMQDIAHEPYLDVLDLMVAGGLKEGRVLLFGDFERQAIFGSGDGRSLVGSRVPGLASHRLSVNCRNTPRIGYQVNLLSRLEPGYRHFRRQDDGIDPVFVSYTSGSDESDLLAQAVRGLRDDGYELKEIVVLSPLAAGSTAGTTTDEWLGQVLQPADGKHPKPGRLQYATIHAYKGLEAPAVIVTDLDRRVVPDLEALLYVGLTRATDRLVAIIESQTLRGLMGGHR